jgi:tyrosyl-tRNA synthetase
MDTPWFLRFWGRAGEPLTKLSEDDFLMLVRPKCKQIVTEPEFKKLLSQKKKLKIKLGVDTTGAELHLGHAVPLMLLRLFLRRGYEVHFVIGDFTGQIGDPAGRTDKRAQLSAADAKKNMKTYTQQIAPLVDLKKTKVHKNSSWLAHMSLAEYLRVVGAISFSQVAQREDFRERTKTGAGVTLREANYASLMAIDSLHLKTDIEVCGIDQLLNTMQAREAMSAAGLAPEVVMATPLIEGTAGDGRKMSKSFNNYIALAASPDEQFGLIMSIPDTLLFSYFASFADVYSHELDDVKKYIAARPHDAKKELGMLIVALLHGERAAHTAHGNFERKFSKKEFTSDDETEVSIPLPMNIVDALFDAFEREYSRTRIRGLIEQGGVRRIRGTTQHIIATFDEVVNDGDVIKVGKMGLFRFLKK